MSQIQTIPSLKERYGLPVLVMLIVLVTWRYGDQIGGTDFEFLMLKSVILIAGPIFALSRIDRPRRPAGVLNVSRYSVSLPAYVSVARFLSFCALIIGYLLVLVLEDPRALGVGAAIFVVLVEWASRRLYRHDKDVWAIAYYNETDGFFGAKDDGQ